MNDDEGVIPLPTGDDTPYGRVYKRLPKGPDLELHIKVLKIDGLEFVNIRDFIISRGVYGKGVFFPRSQLGDVIAGLTEVQRKLGGT